MELWRQKSRPLVFYRKSRVNRVKVKELEKILSLLNFKVYDKDIVNLIKTNINLSGCKTLDSIHLATAMYIKMKTDSEIKILSYDKKMNKVGKKIGLETIISEDKLL